MRQGPRKRRVRSLHAAVEPGNTLPRDNGSFAYEWAGSPRREAHRSRINRVNEPSQNTTGLIMPLSINRQKRRIRGRGLNFNSQQCRLETSGNEDLSGPSSTKARFFCIIILSRNIRRLFFLPFHGI